MSQNPLNILHQKRILLGITGGIAAYKSADLLRRLKEAGADVRVVMTSAATEFVAPLTFQALSGSPVHLDLLDASAEAAMSHIELARWADIILIAPCSANTIAKLAHGSADNLLTSLCLVSKTPLAIAPAMNQAMWADTATQSNIATLKKRSVYIFGPASGSQACGEVGEGRLLEPMDILNKIPSIFATQALSGTRIMITAGPTREAIDPVRYISNHSSGKMGFALAQAAQEMGASVTLITGPVQLQTPKSVRRIDIENAQEMHDTVMQEVSEFDIFISAAAVADYRVKSQSQEKIKKNNSETLSLSLIKNPDILAEVASLKHRPFTVGFAAETQDLETAARSKLNKKSLDMIAANLVANSDNLGFNSDNNALTVLYKDQKGIQKIELETNSKYKIAQQLLSVIKEQYKPLITTNKVHKLNQPR